MVTVLLHDSTADLFSDDGVLIHEEGSTKIIEAMWTTLVVINPPNELPMQAWVEEVRKGIQTVGSHVSAEDQRMWEARLQVLVHKGLVTNTLLDRPMRSLHSRPKRIRRAPFGFVGETSKYFFGTATTEDISELRRTVRQAVQKAAVIYHRTEAMVSVVNQTRRFVKENREDILDLQRHQATLRDQLHDYGEHLSELGKSVNRLVVARTIDGTISQLELLHSDARRQENAFMQQKHELERGWLTENTLATSELETILRKIRNAGFVTPIPEWYYENLHIKPLWSEEDKLVFRVDIPAAGRTHYLQYGLNYFPVPVDNVYIRTIKGLDRIAVNTNTGSAFYPRDCYGTLPRMCMPSKEVLTPTCEYGLVTNGSLNACNVEIAKKNVTSDIFPLTLGNFVVTPFEKLSVTLRCQGQTAETREIARPTEITVGGNCKLETKDWIISGTKQGASKIVRKSKRVLFNRTMNFTMPSEITLSKLEPFKYKERVEIPLAEIPKLGLDNHFDFEDTISSGACIGYIVLVAFVIVTIVINLFVLKKFLKQKVVKRPKKAKKVTFDVTRHSDLQEEVELEKLNVVH